MLGAEKVLIHLGERACSELDGFRRAHLQEKLNLFMKDEVLQELKKVKSRVMYMGKNDIGRAYPSHVLKFVE